MSSLPHADYYELLGVDRDAEAKEIKDAFRAHARRLHPDVCREAGAEDRFAELSQAYAVLSKPTSRILYDRVGYRGRGNGGLAGDRPSAGQLARLFDVAEVEVDSLEAELGATRRVAVTTVGACTACAGTGAKPGSLVDDCGTCEGNGRVRRTSELGAARLLQIDRCPDCGGGGRLIRVPCAECSGRGRTNVQRELKLHVPPGTEDGRLVRLELPDEDREVYLALRVVPHRDARLLRYAAAAALTLAVALFVLLAVAADTIY